MTKNVNKNWLGSSSLPGERLYVDMSSMIESSFGGVKLWSLIVDDYTYYYWSFVMKNKLDIRARIKMLLTDLKIANQIVKFIRCDDAKLIQRSNHFALNLNFRTLELLKEMESLRGSFKHFIQESRQC
jgi:hypothetical protein